MAHGIDSIAYAGATPWTRLGIRMTDAERRSFPAALDRAGLNWDVETIPLTTPSGAIVPDAKGVVRTDSGAYLSTVGKHYTPVQNRDALGLLEPLIDMGCTVEVMASLSSGAMVFGLVKMPESSVDVSGNGDDVRGYALLRNPHDGSGALAADLTPIRVVCQNTLTLAMRTGHSTVVRLRHSTKVADRIADAKRVVSAMGEAFAQTGETFAQLAERKMGPAEIAAYIEAAIPGVLDADGKLPPTIAERRETIAHLVYSGKGNAAYRDGDGSTAWAAYNAITEYFDHVRPAEAIKASAKLSSAESALFGANARLKANALTLARQLVAA